MKEFDQYPENGYDDSNIPAEDIAAYSQPDFEMQAEEIPAADGDAQPAKKYGRAVHETFDWLEAVVYALVTIFILFTFVFRIVGVDGTSMTPTLNNKDWLAISHLNFEPERRDIIVVTRAQELNKPLIKRVIGLGGDEIDIDFGAGIVYVNGEAQQESYIKAPTHRQGDLEFPVTVPEGYVFVMGDNRNDSLDSRFSQVGFIDERYIMGKVVTRVYPFEKIKD